MVGCLVSLDGAGAAGTRLTVASSSRVPGVSGVFQAARSREKTIIHEVWGNKSGNECIYSRSLTPGAK